MIAAACAAMSAGGCAGDAREGYVFGSGHRDDVRTVALPIFGNSTYSHGLEALLTEAIVKEIHRSTPWSVTGAGGAETTLSGSITSVEMIQLSRDRESGLVQELGVQIAVDFAWTDNRTGRPIVVRRDYRGAGSFVPAQAARERLATGEQGAIDALARDIVAELRADW